MASETSAGIPTSQGSQYFRIRASPIMSQGWTKTAAPSSAAAAKTSNSAGSLRFQSLTWLPICTPESPSERTQRSSSRTASAGACSGKRAQAHEAPGRAGARTGQVVVEEARHLGAVLGLRPVGEHHRDGGEHLDVHARAVTVGEPRGRRPEVLLHLAERLPVVLHHAGAAGPGVLEADEAAVAEPLLPAGQLGREEMGVDVDDRHRPSGARAARVPHFRQVAAFSSP